jgi:hypothetical protein
MVYSVVDGTPATGSVPGRLTFNTTPGGGTNQERMRITSSGNVGIANTNPTEKLDITGNLKFSGALMPNNTAGTAGQLLQSNGAGAPTWANPVREVADEYTAAASQTTFTLTQPPSANSKVKMYINGIRVSNTAYNIVGTTLTYNPANNGTYALTAGDRIQCDYFY